MRWTNFYYLIPLAVAAVPLLLVLARLEPRLSTPSSRRTRAELLVLTLLVAYGLVVIYGNFYTSKTYFVYNIGDCGSDTTEQYFPFYLWLVDSVRSGTLSAWTWEFELGVPVQTFQSWLFDPFNLVVVPLTLLLGDAKLSLALTVSQSLKIALSALLFDHLLTRFCETPLARVLGAVLYAFSGFMLMWGQHYWFGAALPLFTATILAFELYLEQSDARAFLRAVLVVALQLVWSAYVSFMILLATALYLLFRIPSHQRRPGLASYCVSIGMLALPVACGLLVACVSVVPYANFLMNETARITSSQPLSERVVARLGAFVHADWIPAILSRMVGTSLLTTGAVTSPDLIPSAAGTGFVAAFPYEFMLLGYSIGALPLLSQFFHWALCDCAGRRRRLILGTSLLVALYCFHELLPSAFNFMVGTQYRSSFALALPFCTAMAVGFERRLVASRMAKGPLCVSIAATLGIVLWSLLHTLNGRLVCLYYLAALVGLGVTLALMEGHAHLKPLLLSLIVAISFSSSVVDGLFATNCRRMVEPDGVPHAASDLDESAVCQALAYLREHDDGLYRLDKTFPNWVPLNDSLIQHYAGASAYNSAPDADVDRFYHQLWSEAISGWAVMSQGFYNSPDHSEIATLLGLRYVLSLDPLDFGWLTPLTRVDGLYVYENDANPSLVSIRQAVVPESVADGLPDAASRRELLSDAVIVPDEVATTWVDAPAEGAAPSSASLVAESETRVSGIIDAAGRSVVCLAIPHTGTWHIRIDGVEADTFRANYGFYGFVVEAGHHEIEAAYQTDGLRLGALLSGAGIVLTLMCVLVLRLRKKRRTDTTNELGGHEE